MAEEFQVEVGEIVLTGPLSYLNEDQVELISQMVSKLITSMNKSFAFNTSEEIEFNSPSGRFVLLWQSSLTIEEEIDNQILSQ